MKITTLFVLVFCSLLFFACKKNNSLSPTSNTAKCKLLTEYSNFNGGNVSYTYSYNTDGTIANISYPPANMAVGYASASITRPASVRAGLTDSLNTYYNANIYTGLPTEGRQSITLDGITQVDYWVYQFLYDAKSRLIQVIETTPRVLNDAEYKLTIFYNDQDNVTQLKYESYTGPNYSVVISATGYDDKPGPYASIKNWPLFMHAAWNSSDPGPIFIALSKNNPLGYTGDVTVTRSMVYIYNENGFPVKRANTNKNSSGSYSFDETYTYQCN